MSRRLQRSALSAFAVSAEQVVVVTSLSSRSLFLVAPVPENAQYGHEDVEQIRVDLDGGADLLARTVEVAQPQGVENQQAAEEQHRDRRQPEIDRLILEEHVEEHGSDQHPQADEQEAAPGAEISAADESVNRKDAKCADGEHGGLTDQSRLLSSIKEKGGRDHHAHHQIEQQDQPDVEREVRLLSRRHE